MIELSVVRDLVAIFGVIAGFSYYILTVRNSQRNQRQQLETRQAQLFMQIYDHWASMETSMHEQEFLFDWEWDDYEDFSEKYLSNVESRALRSSLGKYWEGVGILVKRNLIDPTLVDDLMSAGILLYWEKYAPVVKEYRKRFRIPQAAEYQEYLYNRIKAIAEEQHPELKT